MSRLSYYQAEHDDSMNTYSIDMVRMTGFVSDEGLRELLSTVCRDDHKIVRIYGPNGNSLSYQFIVTFQYDVNAVAKIGLHLNADGKKGLQSFIEYNPNKLCSNVFFINDLVVLLSFFESVELSRFDLAIDIPIERNRVAIIKDNRIYECIRKSPLDFTEYLGRRNSVGRVKLYNKTLDAELDYPLTRLETTCDLKSIHIPKVIDCRNLEVGDRPIVNAVLQNDCLTLALSQLSLYYRHQVLDYVQENIIHFDDDAIERVVKNGLSASVITNLN